MPKPKILEQTGLTRVGIGILVASAAIGGLLVSNDRADYPGLHTILDTAMAMLSGLLAQLLWGAGRRDERTFLRWLSVSFGVAFVLHAFHVLVTVEWSGAVHADEHLRLTTWVPAAYILPTGIIVTILMGRRKPNGILGYATGLIAFAILLMLIFRELPRYSVQGWLGFSRPAILPVLVLWFVAGYLSMRSAEKDLLMKPLSVLAGISLIAHLPAPLSKGPEDLAAILAHLGTVTSYLVFLLALTRMFSADEIQRVEEERGKSEWLASFPERNPNPIIEYDLSRREIRYANPYARQLYPDIDERGIDHPFIAGIDEFVAGLRSRKEVMGRHSVAVGDSTFTLTITDIPDAGCVRIYGADVTELSRAKVELEESEDRFRSMADSAPVLIWVSDITKDCTWFNRRWLDFVGRTLDQEVGRGWAENVHPDDVDRCVSRYEAAYDTREAFTMEYRLRRYDGEWRWVIDQGVPRFRGNHEFTGFIGSCLDIADLRRKEDTLKNQLSRLDLLHRVTRAIGERQDLKSIFQVAVRSLEDNLNLDLCCACVYEPEAHELVVNSVGVRSLATATELAMTDRARVPIDQNGLSRCVSGELVYEPDIANSRFPFPQRLARSGLRSMVAAPLLVETKVFGVLVAARRHPDGFSQADCEFLRQLSEHVALAANHAQLHTALQQAYDDLRQTQQAVTQQERLRALGQMASGIAHDINNAISPVSLYTESLLESEQGLSPRGRGYLETIQKAIDDVAETVARMREFYRPREPELTVRQFLINRLIEQVVELTRARWSDIPQRRGKMIQLKVDLTTDLPPVQGVESEIRDALTNLIFNAVDAMPDGGTLTIGTRMAKAGRDSKSRGGRNIHVEVTDSGVGMSEETQRRCLEPFYTTKGERGTGLGLAMVYGAMQRHGAELEIDSIVGKGTTMRLIFPVSGSLTATPADPVRAVEPLRRLRLLVVDDDPLLLKSLRDALETDGHVITTCDGGQAGIDAFTTSLTNGQEFAAVITDLGMPYVDGRKVASAIKTASAKTPVIMLTGWGQRLAAEGDMPQHVDLVLGKPPKLRELREALATALAS